jgi:hypothetical protein
MPAFSGQGPPCLIAAGHMLLGAAQEEKRTTVAKSKIITVFIVEVLERWTGFEPALSDFCRDTIRCTTSITIRVVVI